MINSLISLNATEAVFEEPADTVIYPCALHEIEDGRKVNICQKITLHKVGPIDDCQMDVAALYGVELVRRRVERVRLPRQSFSFGR